MRKRPLPTVLLTLLAATAATVAIAGCGGKESGGSKEATKTSTSQSGGLKHGKYGQEGKGY